MITKITAADCLDLRTRVLRPGQDIQLCQFAEDNLDSTFHLGFYCDGKIVCNGTFMAMPHPLFPEAKKPYRLRGMATDPNYRGQHLGSQLLQHAEMILQTMNCDLLWFNARESAFLFYEKNGFISIGEMFDIHQVGPHKVMYKWLSSR